MARARNIKPQLFKNEILGQADPLITLLFQSLWLLADREGRLEDRPLRIKAETFPYREGVNTDAMLTWLHVNGFVVRYKVGGEKFIQVVNFAKHQNPHKNEAPSSIPSTEEADANTECFGSSTEKIGSAPADSLSSDSGFLIPSPLIPDSLFSDSLVTPTPAGDGAPPKKPRQKKQPAEPPITSEAWAAYSEAYRDRYGVLPVDNAPQRGKLACFVRKIGRDEAPAVARHYVQSRQQWYVQKKHALDCLVADAEKLRTEWVTGQTTYQRDAREEDRIAATGAMWDRIAQKMESKTNG